MKKKNLIILLIIPFIISLLGIVTINVSINTFYGDISSIIWDYDEVEAIKLSDENMILKATPVNSSNVALDQGNSLIWSCKNKDSSKTEPLAEIVYNNDRYELKTNFVGEVLVTCSNLKGNIYKTMTVIIYDTGAIILTPVVSSSLSNIDDTIYYGQYDLVNNKKVNATVDFNVSVVPNHLKDALYLQEKSSNVDFNLKTNRLTINGSNKDSFFKLAIEGIEDMISSTYKFDVVKDGVNVYTYDDLMYCTNKSENGEVVVLRKSFESKVGYEDAIKANLNNVEQFISPDKEFKDDIYTFETTYNQEYIKQWNAFAANNKDYNVIPNTLNAGLRVQKDFYGNGYTINLHNLTYPSLSTSVTLDDGTIISIPTIDPEKDLFKGPLSFYTLGNPNDLPLVGAYGQDNVGMYVDGNNILINDVNIKNCDNPTAMSFLSTVGSVVDVHGNNVTIKNSRLSNGKHVLRCFSTMDFTLDNSLLSNAYNFLFEVGSNEFIPYDEVNKFDFISSDGTSSKASLNEYLSQGATGDTDLNTYLMGEFETSEKMQNSLLSIQNALNDKSKVEDVYKGSITVKDTYFYNSGIASIVFNTLFNGPFLYQASPSLITEVFSMMSIEGKAVVPLTPTKVSGLSYPVKLDLVGSTKFYDYKTPSSLDITGLIKENISYVANEVFGKDKVITIDTIFPIKTILTNEINKLGYSYQGKVNVPIAFYGGGLNLSTVNMDALDKNEEYGNAIEIDFLDHYLTPSSGGDLMAMAKDVMLKCVTVVTGFEPFKFVCVKGNGYLYGESPSVLDLINNAKGA